MLKHTVKEFLMTGFSKLAILPVERMVCGQAVGVLRRGINFVQTSRFSGLLDQSHLFNVLEAQVFKLTDLELKVLATAPLSQPTRR